MLSMWYKWFRSTLRQMEGDLKRAQGLYIISVAAQILDLHPQTLRKYERAGFVEPPRMGVLRLYSDEDIARLRLIKHFVEKLGLNLAGVELALELIGRLLPLRDILTSEGDPEAARAKGLREADAILHSLGVQVTERQGLGSPVRFDFIEARQWERPARGH